MDKIEKKSKKKVVVVLKNRSKKLRPKSNDKGKIMYHQKGGADFTVTLYSNYEFPPLNTGGDPQKVDLVLSAFNINVQGDNDTGNTDIQKLDIFFNKCQMFLTNDDFATLYLKSNFTINAGDTSSPKITNINTSADTLLNFQSLILLEMCRRLLMLLPEANFSMYEVTTGDKTIENVKDDILTKYNSGDDDGADEDNEDDDDEDDDGDGGGGTDTDGSEGDPTHRPPNAVAALRDAAAAAVANAARAANGDTRPATPAAANVPGAAPAAIARAANGDTRPATPAAHRSRAVADRRVGPPINVNDNRGDEVGEADADAPRLAAIDHTAVALAKADMRGNPRAAAAIVRAANDVPVPLRNRRDPALPIANDGPPLAANDPDAANPAAAPNEDDAKRRAPRPQRQGGGGGDDNKNIMAAILIFTVNYIKTILDPTIPTVDFTKISKKFSTAKEKETGTLFSLALLNYIFHEFSSGTVDLVHRKGVETGIYGRFFLNFNAVGAVESQDITTHFNGLVTQFGNLFTNINRLTQINEKFKFSYDKNKIRDFLMKTIYKESKTESDA